MSLLFEADTADQVWLRAASVFADERRFRVQAGRGGTTREILHAVFTIHDPRQRWVLSRLPSLNPAFAIVEVVWILQGRNDSAFVNSWNRMLPKYAGSGKEYHGAYGHRLRKHFQFDQLEAAYDALRNNPEGRQVVLQIWDPASDFPDESGRPAAHDIPCNVCAILKVRESKLEWLQVTRSNDLFLGVPYNFVQFTSLQEILAGWLDIEVGSYNQVSDSLHVYETDLPNLSSNGLSSSPPNTDSISIPKALSDRVFSELDSRITILAKPVSTEEELWRTAVETDVPAGHQNMLLVVAADAARRNGWLPVADRLMARCTNPTLIKAWERWLDRSMHSKQLVPMIR